MVDAPFYDGGYGIDGYLRAARAYEAVRPGVEVRLYGDPVMMDKVQIRVLAGSIPDVTDAVRTPWALIESGHLLSFDEYLEGPNWEGDQTWRETFLPGSLDGFRHQGKVYAIPVAYAVYAVWYNQRIFKEHGLEPPRTWEEFFETCERLKRAGVAPIAFPGRRTHYASTIYESAFYSLAGAEAYQAQIDLEPGAFNHPAMIRAFEVVQHLSRDYFQPGAMSQGHIEAQAQFFLGQAAMIFNGSWLKSEMSDVIPEDFRLGSFPLPVFEEGVGDPTALKTYQAQFFVFRDGAAPEAAVDFLRFLTSREQANRFAVAKQTLVATRGANEGLDPDIESLLPMVRAARETYGSSTDAAPEMLQAWSNAREDLLELRKTPRQIAAELEAAADMLRQRRADPTLVQVKHPWRAAAFLAVTVVGMLWIVRSVLGQVRWSRRSASRADVVHRGTTQRLGFRGVAMFIGPAALVYVLIVLMPSLHAFRWAFVRWNGLGDAAWYGLTHFRRLLLESSGFWSALVNNLFIAVLVPLCVVPLSLAFAVLILRGIVGAHVLRVVLLFPNFLGGVAAALLWTHLYDPQSGPINAILVMLGQWVSGFAAMLDGAGVGYLGGSVASWGAWLERFDGFPWLSQRMLYWSILPILIWMTVGFNMLLFLAAMSEIPKSLYEAADLDGAGRTRQFWSVTVPMIRHMITIVVVFLLIMSMKTFEVVWLLTDQRPGEQSHVIGTRLVQTMFFELRVGEAAALAVLLFVMTFGLSMLSFRVMRGEEVHA